MDDEVITWNLRGPKRKKKRRELNALIKNNIRYKSLLKPNSSFDMYSLNNASGRLLKNSYDSSSENEDFYFSANKNVIREKNRSYYCRIFQTIIIGLVITVGLLVSFILIFSYAKFHDLINDLKQQIDNQNEATAKNINDITKQLKNFDIRMSKLEKANLTLSKRDIFSINGNDILKNQKVQLSSAINQINLENKLNYFLIEHIFNQTKLTYKAYLNKSRQFLRSSVNDDKDLNSLIASFYQNRTNMKFDALTNKNPINIEDYYDLLKDGLEKDILQILTVKYLNPIMDKLDRCKCPSNP